MNACVQLPQRLSTDRETPHPVLPIHPLPKAAVKVWAIANPLRPRRVRTSHYDQRSLRPVRKRRIQARNICLTFTTFHLPLSLSLVHRFSFLLLFFMRRRLITTPLSEKITDGINRYNPPPHTASFSAQLSNALHFPPLASSLSSPSSPPSPPHPNFVCFAVCFAWIDFQLQRVVLPFTLSNQNPPY